MAPDAPPVRFLSADELLAGLQEIDASPSDSGTLELIVRRPAVDTREIVDVGELDPVSGLVGDNWSLRSEYFGSDGLPDREYQLTIMNARVIALIARDRSRWPLAGDQLFVDLNLSRGNVPPGTRLQIGSAVLQVSAEPHTGCSKFVGRFGLDAVKFVNSTLGRDRQLRGINAKVVQGGRIHRGDLVTKLPA